MKVKKTILLVLLSAIPLAACGGEPSTNDNSSVPPSSQVDESHLVTFVLNDGSQKMEYQTVEHNQLLSVPNNPIRTNYEFLFWSKQASGGTAFAFSTEVITANLTLYANWRGAEFEILFVSEGQTITPLKVRYMESYQLPIPTKDGYEFTAWQLNDENFPNQGNYQLTKGITLNAVWAAEEYKIVFDLVGGELEIELPLNIDEEPYLKVTYDKNFYLPTASKTGYKFDGWFITGDSKLDDGIWQATSDIKVTAKWTALTYKVTFVYGLIDPEQDLPLERELTFDEDYQLPLPTKIGYKLVGWFDGDDLQFADEEGDSLIAWNIDNDDTILYPKFEARKYTVSLDLCGGSFDNEEIKEEVEAIYDATFDAPVPVKIGYDFTGWYYEGDSLILMVDSDGIGQVIYSFITDIELIAGWEAIEYFVNGFDLTSVTNAVDIAADLPVLPKSYYFEDIIDWPVPQRTGYDFVGWYYKNADLTEVMITDANGEGIWQFAENITEVYPQWEAQKTLLILDKDGGVIANEAEKYYAIYDQVVTLPVPTKKGYDFLAWQENKVDITDETGVSATAWNRTSPETDVNLKAAWKAKEFIVDVDPANGDAEYQETVTYDDGYDFGIPIYAGYTFLGWNITTTEGTSRLTGADGILANWDFDEDGIEIVAVYEMTLYTITYIMQDEDFSDTVTHTNLTSFNIETPTFTLSNPIGHPESRIFQGWYLTATPSDGDMPITSLTPQLLLSNITIYAVWMIPTELNYCLNSTSDGQVVTGLATGATFTNNKLIIAEYKDGLPIVEIGESAFDSQMMQKIYIPQTVTTIRTLAFTNTSLISVKLPESLTTIEAEAFSDCSFLTSINLPSGVTSIAKATFFNCIELLSISIDSTESQLVNIGESAFESCTKLTAITLPNTLETIGYRAFRACKGIAELYLPANIITIGNSAFQTWISGQQIYVPYTQADLPAGWSYLTTLTSGIPQIIYLTA